MRVHLQRMWWLGCLHARHHNTKHVVSAAATPERIEMILVWQICQEKLKQMLVHGSSHLALTHAHGNQPTGSKD